MALPLRHCPVTHDQWSFILSAIGVRVMPSKVTVVWSCWKGLYGGHRNSFVLCVTPNCIMWMLCRAGIVSLLEVGRYLISVVDLGASFLQFSFWILYNEEKGAGGSLVRHYDFMDHLSLQFWLLGGSSFIRFLLLVKFLFKSWWSCMSPSCMP